MNAYELADALQETEPYYSTDYKLFDKGAAMLRQQADRIAHLEMLLANRNEIIDKLDLTTPKIKELSDEEIYELWCESDNTELLPEMRNKDGSINYIILTFAELLLEKASEK